MARLRKRHADLQRPPESGQRLLRPVRRCLRQDRRPCALGDRGRLAATKHHCRNRSGRRDRSLTPTGFAHMKTYSDAGSNTTIRERLGLRPIINVSGTMTTLGASIIVPEAISAMAEIASQWV